MANSVIHVSVTGKYKQVPKTWAKHGDIFFDSETKTEHIALTDGSVRPMAGLLEMLAGSGHWPAACTCTTVQGPARYVGPAEVRAAFIRAQAIILAEQQTTLKNAHPAVRIHLARVFKALLKELAV
jgi:hypothetical protein